MFRHILTVLLSLGLLLTGTTGNDYPPGYEALYYGFFFDESVATSIKTMTDAYFHSMLDNLPQFAAFMKSAAENSTMTDLYSYYAKPLDPNNGTHDPYYHVTTQFCGESDCSEYKSKVASQIGNVFQMQLVGYYFTNRTFGIRVKLTEEQEELLPRPVSKATSALPGIDFQENPTPTDFNPTINIAHITIGCAPDIPAQITGLDLMEIIDFEQDTQHQFHGRLNYSLTFDSGNFLDGTGATVVHYHKSEGANDELELSDAFVVYPSVKGVADATFEPYMKKGQESKGTKTQLASALIIMLFTVAIVSSMSLLLPQS